MNIQIVYNTERSIFEAYEVEIISGQSYQRLITYNRDMNQLIDEVKHFVPILPKLIPILELETR